MLLDFLDLQQKEIVDDLPSLRYYESMAVQMTCLFQSLVKQISLKIDKRKNAKIERNGVKLK
jgi:hypothetical protein